MQFVENQEETPTARAKEPEPRFSTLQLLLSKPVQEPQMQSFPYFNKAKQSEHDLTYRAGRHSHSVADLVNRHYF